MMKICLNSVKFKIYTELFIIVSNLCMNDLCIPPYKEIFLCNVLCFLCVPSGK